MYDVDETWNTPGSTFCACCGSRWGGDISKAKKITNPKGIALYRGEATKLDSLRTLRETIQTKNGPLTVVMTKPRAEE